MRVRPDVASSPARPAPGPLRPAPCPHPAPDGVLVVDKPKGLSSHDVVDRMRRVLGVRRIGHTGTLDPLATGVLPLVIGRATRLAALLSNGTKQYDARIRLGLVTDTYDITGRSQGPARSTSEAPDIDAARLDRARQSFLGTFLQQPPPFSAKKIGGVRAYRLARRQQPVPVAPVEVTVSELAVERAGPWHLHARIACSPGFYVRALAHDLGQQLGCGACLEELRRERTGPFSLSMASPLAAIEDAAGHEAPGHILPLASLLADLPRLALNDRGAGRAAHGNLLSADDLEGPAIVEDAPADVTHGPIRLVDRSGALVAIGEWRGDRLLHPTIVLV